MWRVPALSTRETVEGCTPARRATSRSVTREGATAHCIESLGSVCQDRPRSVKEPCKRLRQKSPYGKPSLDKAQARLARNRPHGVLAGGSAPWARWPPRRLQPHARQGRAVGLARRSDCRFSLRPGGEGHRL